jgi:hypothetical protein
MISKKDKFWTAVLTLPALTQEDFSIVGYSLLTQACTEPSLELNNDLASVLSAWAIIFVACPYPVIRDIGLRLGRPLSTLVDPEIVPNVCEFIETHERDFMARASSDSSDCRRW